MKTNLYIRSIVRFIQCTLMLFALLCIPSSCSDELELPSPVPTEQLAEPGYITLSLACGNHTTRAEDEEPGITDLNENLIKSVTLCLSPSAGDRTDADAPAYMQTFTDLDAEGKAILRIPLTTELATRLFNENSSMSCRIFAAANIVPGDAKTVEDLRNLVIDSEFASSQVQKAFAMDGDGTVEYTPGGNYAMGEVKLKRSAAKITLGLDVEQTIEEEIDGTKIEWEPDLKGMSVRLIQGVQTSNLDPTPSINMDPAVYFNSGESLTYSFKETNQNGKYDRIQEIPLYTYPNKWSDKIDEKHGTFLLLSVPWSSDGGKSYRTCYYHVPIIPFDKFELVRNISYHVNLHVGMLGSFVPDEPFEVEAEYYVADWGTEDINVEIKDYRYLVVDQNDFVVNNENSTSIPFYTSHETIVTDVKMTFYRYNFSDQGSEFAVTVSKDQNNASKEHGGAVYVCDFDNKDDILTLEHVLDIWVPYNENDEPVSLTKGLIPGVITNVRDAEGRYFLDSTTEAKQALEAVLETIAYFVKSDDEEYSRIIYEVTVQHKDVADGSSGIDQNLYKETVTITQYPGMYITTVPNYSGSLGQSWASGAYGNTQIDGNYSSTTTYNVINNPSFWNNTKPTQVTDNRWNNSWSQDEKNNYFIAFNAANWNYSLGLSSTYGNWNPNLYLVTVTQLKPGTPYVIGDPRSYNINNFLSNEKVDEENLTVWNGDYYYWQISNGKGPESNTNFFGTGAKNPMNRNFEPNYTYWLKYVVTGFITAPALNESTNRQLRYYYPTREDMSNSNTIAPKFRICSSYGGSSAFMTRIMSRRRAAAYQELGYIAGRWRLPTYGEVRYMIDLAAEQKIPRLFGATSTNTWYYWCAQGAVRVPGKTAADQEVFIEPNPTAGGSGAYEVGDLFTGNNYRDHTRFVYDEWYWGTQTLEQNPGQTPNSSRPSYTFTWGDRLKSNPQE